MRRIIAVLMVLMVSVMPAVATSEDYPGQHVLDLSEKSLETHPTAIFPENRSGSPSDEIIQGDDALNQVIQVAVEGMNTQQASVIVGASSESGSQPILVESDHPYANNFEYTWEIFQPGADQIRLHFGKLDMAQYDYLRLYDGINTNLGYYGKSHNAEDFWTEWYATDTLKLKLETNDETTAYGFLVDLIEYRTDEAPVSEYPAESYHPYANNYVHTWTITQPGADQIRLHFDKLELTQYDYLELYDGVNTNLGSYGRSHNSEDLWTEWHTTNTLKLKLVTDERTTAYGFLVDLIEYRTDEAPTTEYLAESYHPYANNYEYTWTVSEPGAEQVRVHFDKLDLAKSDYLELYDDVGNYLGHYGSSHNSDDLWTEWHAMDTLKLKLVTNERTTSYGFLADLIEGRAEEAPVTEHLAESHHPYANCYEYAWTVSEPGADQIRLHFDKLDLADSDSLIITDELGNTLITYKDTSWSPEGISQQDFWTEWQTTDTVKVKLVTTTRGSAYGFLIDLLEYRTEEAPISGYLAESYHPYANNYEYIWTISQPDANQIRLHFDKLDLADSDSLTISDELGNTLITYRDTSLFPSGLSEQDFWTEWQTTDTVKVKLVTKNQGTAYGFLIDQIEYRNEGAPISGYLAESYHPYANNYEYTWKISQPDADQIRLHFDKLDLADSDSLTISDELGNTLITYRDTSLFPSGLSKQDFWTEWQTTDTVKVKLVTKNQGTAYGFLIDLLEYRTENVPPTEHFAESYHPYANNYEYTWKISQPGANQIRLHFDKLELADSDSLTISDESGKNLITYKDTSWSPKGILQKDFWTEWQTTDTVKVKLVTKNQGTAYGLLIDYIETDSGIIYPTLTANFIGKPTAGTTPLTVQFTDVSTGMPIRWNWSFGDGNTSTDQHPTHTYTTPGTYTVNLTVSTASDSDTFSWLDYITVTRVKGDFNGNGEFDIGDVSKVAYMVVGKTPADPAADFNENGAVDIGDAAKIAYFFVGKIPAL